MDENVKEIARQIMANAFGRPLYEAVEDIARAILAERKRCAACCDHASPGHYAVVASNIREAIESGQ